jgi:uncharacterized protein YyaL (SSP411 family)
LGYPTDGGPRAYVCVGDRCLEPIADPDELASRVGAIASAGLGERIASS